MPNDNFFDIEEVSADTISFDDANETLFSEESKKDDTAEKKDLKKPEKKEEEKKGNIVEKKKEKEEKEEKKEEEKKLSEREMTKSLFGEEEEDEKDEENENNEKDKDGEEEEEEGEEKRELNQFEALSKELYSLGIFSPDLNDDGEEVEHYADNPENFKRLFEYQKRAGMFAMLENHLSRFGQDRMDLFDAIFNKGVDPKEYLPIYNRIGDFENVSLDTEAAQEMIVREAYKRNGLSEDRIASKIQRLKDISELQSEAEDMKTLIVDQDKKALKKQEEDKKLELENESNRDKEYKASLVKILTEKLKQKEFDGIPISEKNAQKTFDYLYTKKWQSKDGKKLTDFEKFLQDLERPENHSLKVKIGLLALQNFDLSSVQKKAVSKESSELFKSLTTKKVKQTAKKQEESTPWNI